MNKRYFILICLLLVGSVRAISQDFDVVPKEISVETGYRYVISEQGGSLRYWQGAAVLADYAWRISGFNQRNGSLISIPLGYSYLVESDTANARILYYGWTIRHLFAKDRRIIPFFGYALLLNQLHFNEIKGSAFGHQTRFEFGTNFNHGTRTLPFAKLEYSYSRIPRLGSSSSLKMHSVEFKVGLRF